MGPRMGARPYDRPSGRDRSELQQLLTALCDGELTDAQHGRLEELLPAGLGTSP